jgi:CheY-like chemotaxis protein
VALSAILSELALEFGPVAAAKQLRMELCDSSLVLNTDRVLFTQLLQNVVANAVKYTDAGFVRISVNLEADAVALDIEDSGVGIPEDKLDRVFDEYYQVDPRGAQRSGVGLGLAIVREVSRLLGYSVAVSSTLGTGTRIRVRIPVERVAAQDTGSLAATPSNLPVITQGAASFPQRLILLEDNDAVRKATELFLSLEGFHIRSAATVAEAETLLADIHASDLFISDYQLDGPLTGLDILHELRAREGRNVPAILMSGDLQSMLRMVKTDIPRCRFLSKPVDATALLAAIQELARE